MKCILQVVCQLARATPEEEIRNYEQNDRADKYVLHAVLRSLNTPKVTGFDLELMYAANSI